jgi:diadenosine tetraphosphate (Ap4A) HIT family hydrolase
MSTLHRSRKGELTYRKYLKNHVHAKKICVFCEIEKNGDEVIKKYPFFMVITNAFPYTIWDSTMVAEHLMVVPRRHIESMSKFTKEEIAEYHKITSEYENNGWDIYTRGVSATMKSIPHQHTHLIKSTGQKIKGLVYVETPLIHKVIK